MRLGTLYGRDDLVQSLERALAAPGVLVTLTGLPGSGRTSVARAAADQAAGPDGWAVVDGRQAMLPGSLEEALGTAATAPLVVVDDVDHAHAFHQVVRDLRLSRPDLRLLLVSSSPLGLPGEMVVRLPSLPLPDLTQDPAGLRTQPAVQLFLDVSRRTGATVPEGDGSVLAAAEICRLVGGLPLAISLVAARTVAYAPTTLVALLARSPILMLRARGGAPGTGERHDLVEALLWSVSLLTPGQQALLRDLVVFRNPVTLEVLDTVCGRGGLLDDLSALVDVHLLDPVHDGSGSRFSLPPLVRDHLVTDTAGPTPLVRERHRRWAVALAAEVVRREGSGRLHEAGELAAPHEADLAAALHDALAARDVEAAQALALALAPVAFSRGVAADLGRVVDDVLALTREARGSAARVLPHQGRTSRSDALTLAAWRELLRAETAESTAEVSGVVPVLEALREEARSVDDATLLRVTYLAVQAARSLVERSAAEEWVAEGRALASALGDHVRLVRLETWSGMLAHQRGDVATATSWALTALDRARRLGEPSLTLGPAGLLHGLPRDPSAPLASDLPSPDQLVRLARRLGDLRSLDWLEPTAAFHDLGAGDLAGACAHSAATLRRARATGARLRAAPALLCLFMVALRREELMWAGRLLGALGRYLDVMRPALPISSAAALDSAVAAYQAAAARDPDLASDVMWGANLSWDEGVDTALGYAAAEHRPHAASPNLAVVAPPSPRTGARHPATPARTGPTTGATGRRSSVGQEPLTSRERDVLEHLADGRTNREISEQLGISVKTVMHHTSSIYRKLAVRGRAEAVAWHVRARGEGERRDAG